MLLAVVGFSFFTRVLSLSMAIVYEENRDFLHEGIDQIEMILHVQSFVKILLLLHSSINVVFYTISREFRLTIMVLFHPRMSRETFSSQTQLKNGVTQQPSVGGESYLKIRHSNGSIPE